MKPHTHTTHHASIIAAALSRLFPARRFVLALFLALLPALAISASAAGQFSTLTISGSTYDASKDQSGHVWTWTASTNTLVFDYDYDYVDDFDSLINGNIAFATSNPAAVATIEVSNDMFINGNISCQGTLLVNVSGYVDDFIVNGTLGGSLSVTSDNSDVRVSISNDITGNLSVGQGNVKVKGKVTGNLTVSDGVATINGTVGGTRNITGGIVKVNGSFIKGGPPANITTNVIIPLDALTRDVPTSGNGWQCDGETLYIEGSLINYTLTGVAPSGICVDVADTVNGSLSLDSVMIDNGAPYYGDALYIRGSNLTVYIKNNNTLVGRYGGLGCFGGGVLTLDAAAGSTLTAIVGSDEEEGIRCYNDLVLQGSGTFNLKSGNFEQYGACSAIWVGGDLLLQDSVTVNATAGDNNTGINPDDSGWNNGIECLGDLTIADNAKLNATGGNASAVGCSAGNGIELLSKLTVTSTAANALVATGGVGAVVDPLHGSGIAADFDLQIAGTGSIKAIGDNALASVSDITIAGCKITAQASGNASYALHAGGYDGANFAGGTVFITGGTTTASNITTPANIYYKTLNQTGGSLNGVNKGGDSGSGGGTGGDGGGGGNTGGGSSGGGGGGGGAPSLPGLALIAAMLAARAMKKKNSEPEL